MTIAFRFEGLIEMRFSEVLGARGMQLKGSIIDEDVEFFERTDSFADRVFAKRTLCDIAGNQEASSPFCLDGALCRCRIGILVKIDDSDIGALARKKHGDRAANAAIAARNKRDLVTKLARAL